MCLVLLAFGILANKNNYSKIKNKKCTYRDVFKMNFVAGKIFSLTLF